MILLNRNIGDIPGGDCKIAGYAGGNIMEFFALPILKSMLLMSVSAVMLAKGLAGRAAEKKQETL